MNKIRVLIVDDHSLLRQGLSQLLSLETDIDVIGTAQDGEEAISKCQELKPDVVLMDINMPKVNGIQALRRIKDIGFKAKVIMLTIHDDREYLYETMNLGAEGYVLKDTDSESLVEAIRSVHEGNIYIHPSLTDDYMKKTNRAVVENAGGSTLTKREYEVLVLIAEGNNNKEIAEKLYISEKTVKNHVSSIFKKIGVNDRTQAAIYAYKNSIKKL
jgi:DNA-binding NarL/FixJ family response regulator